MAYSRTVSGPPIKYTSSTGSNWNTGYDAWTRWEASTLEKRPKPAASDLVRNLTSYTKYERYVRRGASTYTKTPPSGDPYWTRGSNGHGYPAPVDFDNTTYQSGRRAVVVKLLKKIKDEDWNLSTFLGELPETIRYFGKTLSTVVRTYRAVKRGDLTEIRRMRKNGTSYQVPRQYQGSALNKVSGKWLEWRYAISPLMYDLDDMLKALYASRMRALYTRRVSGDTLHYSRSQVVGTVGTNPVLGSQTHNMHLRLGCYVKINPDVDAFKRLGLLNPLATLWELFPLSFVYDWFIPVGEYLGSLDALAGVQVLSTWESRQIYTQALHQPAFYQRALYGGGTETSTSGYSEAINRSYTRQAGVSLALSFPSFSLSINSKRFLDGLALARQAVAR